MNMKKATLLDLKKDVLTDDPKIHMRWVFAENGMFDYSHSRPLPHEVAQKAIDYIAAITKRYPFQMRYILARAHWERFAQEWCDTGDERSALRVI